MTKKEFIKYNLEIFLEAKPKPTKKEIKVYRELLNQQYEEQKEDLK
jgi:hypothetical protein